METGETPLHVKEFEDSTLLIPPIIALTVGEMWFEQNMDSNTKSKIIMNKNVHWRTFHQHPDI